MSSWVLKVLEGLLCPNPRGPKGGVSAGLRQAFCAALVVTQANSARHVDDSDGEVQVCNGCERESVFFVIQDCRKFKGCR